MSTVFHLCFPSDKAAPTAKTQRFAMRWGGRALLLGAALSTFVLGGTETARADGNWVQGNAFDAITLGRDADGTPLQPCLATDPNTPGSHPGKTRRDWSACAFGYGGREVFASSYSTLRPTWTRSRDAGTAFGRETDGRAQSFCRGPHAGGLQVGKKIAGDDGCYIPYGGQEIRLTNYEVLTQGASFGLRLFSPQAREDIAIVAGYEADGTALYACTTDHEGGVHLGKTRRNWTDCMISYGGREVTKQFFQVVIPNTRPASLPSAPPPLRAGAEGSQALGVCSGPLPNGGNSWQVGKWLFSNNTCNVSFGGQEVRLTDPLVLRVAN